MPLTACCNLVPLQEVPKLEAAASALFSTHRLRMSEKRAMLKDVARRVKVGDAMVNNWKGMDMFAGYMSNYTDDGSNAGA